MKSYHFICRKCGSERVLAERPAEPPLCECGRHMRRHYQAENVTNTFTPTKGGAS